VGKLKQPAADNSFPAKMGTDVCSPEVRGAEPEVVWDENYGEKQHHFVWVKSSPSSGVGEAEAWDA